MNYRKRALVAGAAAFVTLGAIGAIFGDDGKKTSASPGSGASTAPTTTISTSASRTTSATPTRAAATSTTASTVRPAASGYATVVLARLATKGRAPMTGYTRAQFGQAWTDATNAPGGHNGCGTRDDILAAQLNAVVRSGPCKVTYGNETDPYTGAALHYVRGRSTVDIDHVAALGDAWQTGAQKLTLALRTQLANDPLNLLAVSSSANRQKGDADAASWLPRVKGYRCAYVARQIAVKYRYGLWVTAAERAAMSRILSSCPTQTVPTGGAGRAIPAKAAPAPRPTTTTAEPVDTLPTTQPSDVYYENCTAVRAAGAAPLHVGEPGYRSGLDRDGDGVACE